MDFYNRKNLWKLTLFLFALLIGAGTLWYTETFLQELRKEELRKMNIWAMSINTMLDADNTSELTLPAQIIEDNNTIPVIVTDGENNIIHTRNLPASKSTDQQWLQQQLEQMREDGNMIEAPYKGKTYNRIYFQNSTLLTKLRFYPLVLLLVIALFVGIAYVAFSSARKSEQNRVWNGLAKETAHQIGTPLSSLMGWLEMLKLKEVDPSMISEMEKDINRLNTITDRFSKIGSQPERKEVDVVEITRQAVEYLRSRSPKKIKISLTIGSQPLFVKLNVPLYEWVIENLIRNAIDAIEKQGEIELSIADTDKLVKIEVADTGKGISPGSLKTVFRPGYSTKKRGWGLGLSLAKRIIEEYHDGKIYVLSSQPGVGTTFRINLKKLG